MHVRGCALHVGHVPDHRRVQRFAPGQAPDTGLVRRRWPDFGKIIGDAFVCRDHLLGDNLQRAAGEAVRTVNTGCLETPQEGREDGVLFWRCRNK